MDMDEKFFTNVGQLVSETAAHNPTGLAVAMPTKKYVDGRRQYQKITFAELNSESNRIADAIRSWGVPPGAKLALLVPPSIEFISLVFALFKAGVTQVLIDPGMGKKNMMRCLAEVQPDGFVAIPLAQAIRTVLFKRFPNARYNVTVGSKWFWGGKTLAELQRSGKDHFDPKVTSRDTDAAIIFTTGSTGPPKGVLYSHGNFLKQASEIRDYYGIEPGDIDLPGFPLFALFNCAMGVSTVIPDMDPTRPAKVDPVKFIEAARDFGVTQSFGSPALWNTVGRYCEQNNIRIPTIRRVLSAGAPVPPHVLKRVRNAIREDGEVFTPYGATEALPVASNSASVVLGETAALSSQGKGTCVGKRFSGIDWQIIEISDEPITTIDQAKKLSRGSIGELIVRGEVVTRRYVTRTDANALHKIVDGESFWHRMGDVGYLDDQDRFWFCGRKSHRVLTATGTMFTIPCEAIANNHPAIYRSALVGIGNRGSQIPVLIAEPWTENWPKSQDAKAQLTAEIKKLLSAHPLTKAIEHVLLHPSLPVDIRHNSKIFREKLGPWAAEQLRSVLAKS